MAALTWEQLETEIEDALDTAVHASIQILKQDIQKDWPC